MSGQRRIALSMVVAMLVFLGAGVALGDRVEGGKIVVALNGDMNPRKLPRSELAPVSVHLRADFSTIDDTPLPRLRRITMRIGSRGRLVDVGLPVCPARLVRATTDGGALAACGRAKVGHGHLRGDIALPGQLPLPFNARFFVFNSRTRSGGRVILGSVHSANPPVSFTLPFVLRHRPGAFGTTLTAELPEAVGKWARMRHFDITIERRYRYRGERRSYVNASCAVPEGFTGLVFPLAQARFDFAGDRRITGTVVRACRVRK